MRNGITLMVFITLIIASCANKTTLNENIMPKPIKKNAGKVKTGYAQVNGINMYYEVHGQGNPLVLLHGGGSTLFTSFAKIIPLLAGRRQVIAVELQAHGRTSDRNAPGSFEQDADDVAALLKHLIISKADIMGFSNGGSTSLQLAIRHPECVDKLVAISAIYKRDGMQPGFFDFMQNGTFSDMPQLYKDAFLSVNNDPQKLLNMFNKDRQRMLDFKDWSDELIKSIEVPVLVMVGDKDVVRPEHAMELARLVPKGQLAVLPGGHGDFMGEAMATRPNDKMIALTAAMIDDFLGE